MIKKTEEIFRFQKGVKAVFTPYFFLFLFFTSCSEYTGNEKKLVSSFDKNFYINSTNKDSLRGVIGEITDSPAKNALLFDLSYYFYRNNKPSEFRYWNEQTFHTSEILNDTLKIAEAHWDLGNFFYRQEIGDSAFFHYKKAANFYRSKQNKFLYARMLLNIAILQKNIKDYPNSEANTLTALKIIIPLKEHRQIYIGYNNLGILYNQLGEYQNAIVYHNKAYETARKLSDNFLEAASLNNIGVVYEKLNLYEKAIENFDKALEIEDLAKKHRGLYAMIRDNRAYSRFKLGHRDEVLSEMLTALELRKQEEHEAGIVINKIHLGEYFLATKDTLKGKKYFIEAKKLAEKGHLHRDLLQSLLFLSKADKKNSSSYLTNYIALHDSLEQKERSVRSKFARIELETDKFIAENEQLTEQRKWIVGGAGSIVTMLMLFFVIWRQKSKNKKLSLEKEQRKANEEIYNLLLEQERKVELEKQKEKDRISRELHDGVLGEMYGVRFNLLNLISRSDETALKTKEELLVRLQEVESDIRHISRDLQKNNKLEEAGFQKLISQLCSDFPTTSGVKISVNWNDGINWSAVKNPVKMNLYRIVQEALLNIEKYAFAKEAEITFSVDQDRLVLIIADNGKGFDVTKSTSGIGLKNMASRTEELGGDFRVLSGGDGTEIRIKIPIDE